LIAVWAALAVFTLASDFNAGTPVTVGLCAIVAYIMASDAAIRLLRSLKA
jgi:phosphatidylcholine synthase